MPHRRKKSSDPQVVHGAKWTALAPLLALRQIEAPPSPAARAAAGDLVQLGDLAPPLCFLDDELVHGAALLAAAADAGAARVLAVDLEPLTGAERAALAAAWSTLARALEEPAIARAALRELEAGAAATAAAYLADLARSRDPLVRRALALKRPAGGAAGSARPRG